MHGVARNNRRSAALGTQHHSKPGQRMHQPVAQIDRLPYWFADKLPYWSADKAATLVCKQADLCLLVIAGGVLGVLLLFMVALRLGHHQLLVLLCCQSLMGPPGSRLQWKGNT